MPILTQKALLLAKVETTAGVDAAPTASSNAILVMEPNFTVESDEIARNFASPDFSRYPTRYGMRRGVISFSVEVAGSGTANTAPVWSALLEGCAFLRTAVSAGSSKTIAAAPSGAVRASNITTFTTSAAHGLTVGQNTVIAGVTDSSFNGTFTVLSAPTTTTFTVYNPGTNGTSGAGTSVGSASVLFTPATDNLKTLTLWLYFDGLVHKMTGAMGTFTMNAEAGQIATLEFTFTGNFSVPTTVSFPTPTYESVIPPLVELAGLAWNGSSAGLFAGAFSLDMANEIAIRRDVNSANGMHSVYISGRNPTGGMTPEVSTALNDSFWADWSASTTRTFTASIGTAEGNEVTFFAPSAQIANLPYGDRDNIKTYEVALAFRRGTSGNDEMLIRFE